jgi:hypothetical protein
MYIQHKDIATHNTLRLSKIKENLTDYHIQEAYPGRYRTFLSEDAARKFASEQVHAYVCRLIEYYPSDIIQAFNGSKPKIRPGAVPHTKGWLVSMVSRARQI